MPFINEDIIEQIADRLDAQPENYEILVREFQDAQPALMGYILSEDTAFLTPDERDYFLYIGLIIWDAIRSQQPELLAITADQISDAEELNWEKLEGVSTRDFRERLNVFFTNYPQEDLLAFVEDALIPDEESPITNEGREPLFIALKTIIDVLT